MVSNFLNMDILFLQKHIDSFQEAFINPSEPCDAVLYDGYMHFIGLQNLNTHLLPL